MEPVSLDGQALHLLIRDLSPSWIAVLVQFRANRQPRLYCRVTNEVDHLPAHQRPTTPVLHDMAEHAVLDLVPLACPWREVAHRNGQPTLIGKPLPLDFPQAKI